MSKSLYKLAGILVLLGGLFAWSSIAQAYPVGICPAAGATTDCGVVFTINPDLSITTDNTGQGPYDGIEDTLVGVLNNSSSTINSLVLSGSNIFGFDGDGICTYLACSYDASGYAGPNTSFSIVDASNGSVNFLGGLAGNGGTAWFSLEEPPSALLGGTVKVGVPEPSSLLMLSLGLLGIGLLARRRKSS